MLGGILLRPGLQKQVAINGDPDLDEQAGGVKARRGAVHEVAACEIRLGQFLPVLSW